MADIVSKKNITIIEEANEQLDLVRENLEVVYKELVGIKKDFNNEGKNILEKLDFSNIVEELDFSQLFEELGVKVMKKVRNSAVKKSLQGYSYKTIISTLIKSIAGNKTAKNALSLMFKPLSSYAPWLMLPEVVDYYLNLARESADLTEKIEELGEEEGRIAAGNGMWDKAAIHQYDMQKVDSDILYKRLFSNKDKKEEGEDFSDWLSQVELDARILMETIEPLLSLETWQELGNNIRIGIEESWNEFVTWFKETAFGKWTNEILLPWFTKDKWLELLGNIRTAVEDFWNEFTVWFNETAFGKWINETLLPWFIKDKWKELLDNIKKAAEEKWDEFTIWFSNTGFGKWINEEVMPWFTKETWLEIFRGIEEALPETIKNGINGAVGKLNEFIDWVNEKLKIEWEALFFNGEKVFEAGAFQLLTIPHIPTFSIGGFPEDGLFMANHGELVGQFGNGKTVVANNEQIISGIKYGVKDAVSEVLAPYLADIAQNTRETADKDFSTYIGDKEIARASERGRRAIGMRLITEF